MYKYLIRRLLLFIPTLFGITLICFLIINLAPGGPIERQIAKLRFGGGLTVQNSESQRYNISQEVIESLKKKYGFDKPVLTRYFIWLKNIGTLDFGNSFIYEEPAVNIVLSKLPVSIQFGLISFLLIYLISIPLGIYKAVKDSNHFDIFTSLILLILYAAPPLVLGILLKTYLAGGSFLDWFPIGDLYSDEYFDKNLMGRILDRTHHFVLPTICYTAGGFTVLTFLMKNSFLECLRADYVRTAYSKGLNKKAVLFKHVLKNSLIPIVTGMGNFLQLFLAGSLIVEKIFNLDGIGLLSYQSAVERDFHVLLALLVFQSILALAGRLMSDLTLPFLDPRITFSK